ncbi:MAG: GNAT family N-acetyltransferase [Myxococcales bacterium]|nr:MAG: GNAT family N-acetyltransferase [Myxococcales bacterium]
MIVRTASLEDVAAIARLSGELGYPCDPATMAARVEKISSQKRHLLLVAQNDRGEVCGWLHAFSVDSLVSGFRVEIGGLVVAKAEQRSGIGGRLVEAAEQWALEIGAEFVSVRSSVDRIESHSFYRKRGYELKRTQQAYRKRLR